VRDDIRATAWHFSRLRRSGVLGQVGIAMSASAVWYSSPLRGDAVQHLVAALRSSRWVARAPRCAVPIGKLTNLVDPASSHMLVSKIKPCMSQYKPLHDETANGSLKQL
jgi:hypothetical protein